MKIANIEHRLSKFIVSFLVLLVPAMLTIKSARSQNNASYFEQQSNTIAIEVENGQGIGWIVSSLSDASGDQVVLIPKTDTLIFQPTQDTYVNRDAPNTPYGAQTELLVDGKGGDKRGFFITTWWNGKYEAFEKAAFLKFEVSGLTDIVVEAKVFLYCLDSGLGGAIYALDPMRDNLNWTEDQATWNFRPSTDHDANTIQDYVGNVSADHWHSFDVSQALYGNENGNFSFGIVMQNDQYTAWSSKEGSYPPYLWLRVKRSGLNISGENCYYGNSNPIMNVKLEITGGINQIIYSNSQGNYIFEDLPTNLTYTVSASKTPDTDIGPFDITTYDAALTAQAAVGVRILNQSQQIAADVSRDGKVYTFDAALIAQYAVDLPKLPVSHVGEWILSPESYCFESLSVNQTEQNFTGILLGNVHGGWSQQTNLQQNNLVSKKYEKISDITVIPGALLEIPLQMPDEDEIISLDIEVSFDPQVMRFLKLKRTGLTSEANLVYKSMYDRVKIGIYSITPIRKLSDLFILQFKATQNSGSVGTFSLDRFQMNNKILMKNKAQIFVGETSELPTKFDLFQNYPNPFVVANGMVQTKELGTKIRYQLPQPTEVNLSIYNYLGQKVRTLYNGRKGAGVFSAIWDGQNDNGELVSAGVYICRLAGAGKAKMIRLVMLH